MKDLWGFTKESLEADNSIINKILIDQATLLTKKTDGVLRGKVSNRVITAYREENLIETTFEVSVPNLEDYIASLFYVYSKPEENYPVYITFERVSGGRLKREHLETIFFGTRGFSIKSEEEIEKTIVEVLGSKYVNNTIKVLYQKGSIAK